MLIVDSQVHIWEGGVIGPHHRQVETFSKDDLLAEMAEAGVDAVLLHPPGSVPGSNELALAAAAAHPDKFAVLANVPPDTPDESRELLDARAKMPGFKGLRYIFRQPGRENWPTDGTMNWIYADLEERGLPLAMLAHSFLPTLGEVAERHPGLKLMVDHLGVEPSSKDDEAFESLPDLLALAKHPNVSVKLSDAPVHSTEAYPYRNLHDHIHRIFDAFGPERCFWGTDLSREPCTYRQCVTMFTEELPWLTGRDLELVMGRALCDWIGWDLPG